MSEHETKEVDAVRDAAHTQSAEAEHDPQFEPVIKLENQVEVKTHEEDEDVQFKM